MGCCGQKRTTLANHWVPTPTGKVPRAIDPRGAVASSVAVRYLAGGPVVVRGPLTGRAYSFSGAGAAQVVDARDAVALLRTRFFRQA